MTSSDIAIKIYSTNDRVSSVQAVVPSCAFLVRIQLGFEFFLHCSSSKPCLFVDAMIDEDDDDDKTNKCQIVH